MLDCVLFFIIIRYARVTFFGNLNVVSALIYIISINREVELLGFAFSQKICNSYHPAALQRSNHLVPVFVGAYSLTLATPGIVVWQGLAHVTGEDGSRPFDLHFFGSSQELLF